MASAINGSGRVIYPGMALVVSNGVARLATGGTLANYISTDGAPAGGVVTIASTGVVFLDTWILSTGGEKLATGAVYYAGLLGNLTLSAGAQALGQAISSYELSLHIQVSVSPAPYVVVPPAPVPPPDTTVFGIVGSFGPPTPRMGKPGEIYFDLTNKTFYGPKKRNDWGSPHPIS